MCKKLIFDGDSIKAQPYHKVKKHLRSKKKVKSQDEEDKYRHPVPDVFNSFQYSGYIQIF